MFTNDVLIDFGSKTTVVSELAGHSKPSRLFYIEDKHTVYSAPYIFADVVFLVDAILHEVITETTCTPLQRMRTSKA